MSRHRREESRRTQAELAGSFAPERARHWLLAAAVAMHVAWPLLPSESISWTADGLLLAAGWSALGIAWALAAWLWPELAPRVSRADIASGVFLLLYLAACLVAVKRAAPRPALNLLAGAVALGWSYWLPRQLLRTPRERRAMVVVMIGLAAGVALVACQQFFVTLPADRAHYAADPDAALREAGLWYPPGSRERSLYEQRLRSLEPFGTFSLTNSMAGFLAPWTVAAAGIALGTGSALSAARRAGLTATTIGPQLLALLLSKSRSAWGAVALAGAGLATLAVAQSRRVSGAAIAGGVGLLALLLAVAVATGGIDREVLSEAPKSLGYRWLYWQATLPIVAEHPLLGCGPGSFDDAYTRFKSPLSSEEIKDPHNFVLEIAATAGLPAAAALLVALALVLGPATRNAALPDNDSGSLAWVFMGGAFAGLVVTMVLGPAQSVAPGGVELALVALSLGAALAFLWPWIDRGELSPNVLRAALAALLINLLAAGGIGYPGLAASVWLLAALLASSAGSRTWNARQSRIGWLLPIAAGALFILVEVGAVLPALGSRAALLTAATEPEQMAEQLEAAAQADRFGYEPWQRMLQRELEQPEASTPEQVDRIVGKLLAAKPRSSSARVLAGRAYANLADVRRDEQWRGVALEHFAEAARLYPTSPAIQAELARGAARAGRAELAREAAGRALQLDADTPHYDVKLPPATRAEMERLAGPDQASPSGDHSAHGAR